MTTTRAWRSDTAPVISATAERAIRTSSTFVRRAVNAEALRRLAVFQATGFRPIKRANRVVLVG